MISAAVLPGEGVHRHVDILAVEELAALGDSDLAEVPLEVGVEAADFDLGQAPVVGLADNA